MSVEALVRWFDPKSRQRPAPDPLAFDAADFSPALQTRLLVLQPTPFCNIDCDYCYLPDRGSTARMGIATVRQAARRLLDDGLVGSELTVVWHAGEPLTLAPAYYDEAIDALERVLGDRTRLSHSVQTNATLIDGAWCAFFRRHRIRVGVSVDGPQALHDAHRRTRAGKGTHARVLRGMACLREHGIDFHAIAVVTPATFEQPDAFVDFFEAQGVREIGCNFDEAEGLHASSSLAGHERAHGEFVEHLLERSAAPGSTLRIRELAIAARLVAEPLPRYSWRGRVWPYNSQVLPFALVNVAHNGDFNTFSPELLGHASAEFGPFVFGNVADTGYLEAGRSAAFNRVWSAIVRGVEACDAACSHFGFCGGGAPANKLYENGRFDSAETLYCRTMVKRPFDAVLARLEGLPRRAASAT